MGAKALLGPTLDAVEDAAVVVTGGIITAAGRREDVELANDLDIIDLPGTTFLPGFIDAHVHIGFYEPATVLAGGVTTVRDLGWPPRDIFSLARRSKELEFDGPVINAAGAMLTAPGGYPTTSTWAPEGTGLEISGSTEARDAVEHMVRSGASVIKVALNPPAGPTLDADTLGHVVEAAHDNRLRVTGHVHGLEELDKALDAGLDELAHMLMGLDVIPPSTIERMVDRGLTVVPTLAIRRDKELEVALTNLRNFTRSGGRVVYGTDLGNTGSSPGIDLREVQLMAEAGMSTVAILHSATVGAADWMNLSSTGVLEAGRDADIIGFAGDPLDGVSSLGEPRTVVKKGRRVL